MQLKAKMFQAVLNLLASDLLRSDCLPFCRLLLYLAKSMPENPTSYTVDSIPLRAPQRWFKCVEYAGGLKIELPYADEASAVAAGIIHLSKAQSGNVKIGYYGFRSRVIVYTAAELKILGA